MKMKENHEELRFLQEDNATSTNQGVKRPLQYYDELRESMFPHETRNGSAMYRVNDTTRNETIRLAHVASLNPYSEMLPDGTRLFIDFIAYMEASVFLALHHFNQRSSEVLPHLPDLLQECNVHMTIDIIDTLLSPLVASRTFFELSTRQTSLSQPPVLSLAGAVRSATSKPLAILAGVYHVPIVNGVSTSSALDQTENHPTFVRTVPNNSLDSLAVVTYLHSLGVSHFGVIFVRDPYGSEFARGLQDVGEQFGMTVISAAYSDGNEREIASAVRTLQQSQFKYFFAAITPSPLACKSIISNAVDLGIAGNPQHMWLWPETNLNEVGFYRDSLDGSSEKDRKTARAITGMGMIFIDIPSNDEFDAAFTEMGRNDELYDYFVSKHDAPELFTGFEWNPRPFFYQRLNYDSIIALGIALCEMEQEFPTGEQIVEAVKATEFLGVSGPVSFDNITGTRTSDSVSFKLVNVIVDVQGEQISADYHDAALINGGTGEVEVLAPYVYAQDSAKAPESLPPVTLDPNLIETGALATGWCLAGIGLLLSVGFALFAYRNRTRNVIRVAQPAFLGLLCIGTTLMASTIIPLGFQEPMSQDTLNRACISLPWLFIMGFATAFSSLFCKTLRLDKLFRNAAEMRRVEVKVKDVIWPFVLLTVINFVLLLAWTIVDPLQWSRVEVANYDSFGRSVESFGSCFVAADDETHGARIGFLITLGVVNFAAVLLANYESYRIRNIPSDFNESFYLTLSMFSILESFLVGVPILFLGYKSPTAFFVVASLLISVMCLAILVPIFVPKILMRRQKSTLQKNEWHSAWSSYDTAGRAAPEFQVSSSGKNKTQQGSGGTTVADIRARAATSSVAKERTPPTYGGTVAEIRARAAARTKALSEHELTASRVEPNQEIKRRRPSVQSV